MTVNSTEAKALSTRKNAWLWIAVAVIGRLIPHPWNMTPNLALSVTAGWRFSLKTSLIISFFGLVVSDMLLALIQHHAIWGSWSLFTYSGLMGVCLLGRLLPQRVSLRHGCALIGASVGFWLWTNVGVWLTTPMYANTLAGLLACFSMAIPFLEHALIGDSVWFIAIVGLFRYYERSQQHRHPIINR